MVAVVLAVLAVTAAGRALAGPVADLDAIAMVQSGLAPRGGLAPKNKADFQPGDHVLLRLGQNGELVLKANIIARGASGDTYDVHLWTGPPESRDRLGVPMEMLSDARPVEEEAEWQAGIDRANEELEKERQAKLAEEREIHEDQMMRLQEVKRKQAARAEEEKRLKVQRAAEAKERIAKREAEERAAAAERNRLAAEAELKRHLKLEEERKEAARKKAEEEANRRAAAEEAQRKLEEEEREEKEAEELAERRAAAKEKWEVTKQQKLKEARAEHASREVQHMILASDKFKREQEKKYAAPVRMTQAKPQAGRGPRITFTVRAGPAAENKEARLTVLRTASLEAMMREACKRLGLRYPSARFFHAGKLLKPTDSGFSLHLRDSESVDVRAPRAE